MKVLSDLLALGEGFTIEFKRSLRSDLRREISAFANATGGVILLGLDDDGTVRGVEGHNRLKPHFDESPCRRFSLDSNLDEDTWAVAAPYGCREADRIGNQAHSRSLPGVGTACPRDRSHGTLGDRDLPASRVGRRRFGRDLQWTGSGSSRDQVGTKSRLSVRHCQRDR